MTISIIGFIIVLGILARILYMRFDELPTGLRLKNSIGIAVILFVVLFLNYLLPDLIKKDSAYKDILDAFTVVITAIGITGIFVVLQEVSSYITNERIKLIAESVKRIEEDFPLNDIKSDIKSIKEALSVIETKQPIKSVHEVLFGWKGK